MSPESGSNQADAVVIGAGVIGTAITFELAKRGLDVISVDTLPAAGYGSTSSSSAIVRFHYSTRAGVAMAWEGKHFWADWANHVAVPAEAPDDAQHQALAEFIPVRTAMLLDSSQPRPRYLDHFDSLALPYRLIPAEEAEGWPMTIDRRVFGPPARLEDANHRFWGEPQHSFDQIMIEPHAGYISDPQLAAQNLCTAAAAAGARFRFNAKVVAVGRREAKAGSGQANVTGVTLADGTTVSAPVVVNVAGPHSSIINALAGVTEDMARTSRALRREVYIAPAPPGFDESNGFMSGDLDVGIYYRPERGHNILVGSAEPECDELHWVDPDDYDETLSEDEFQLNMLRAARRLPELGIPHSKRGLVALYDASDDWTPIYDRSNLDGFYLACGSSGNQFKNAPIAGHCMAELITAVEGGHDHDRDPVVVTGPHTGVAIELGTFSRLRPVDSDAAHTVLG